MVISENGLADETLPQWVQDVQTEIEVREIMRSTDYCPVCGAEMDDFYGFDCGCYADIHYGKD